MQEVWSPVCGRNWATPPLLNEQQWVQHHLQSHRQIPCGGPFYQQGPYRDGFIGHDCQQCWKEDAILRKIRKSRWIRTLKTSWPLGMKFNDWRSLVHLLYSPFQPNKPQHIINNGKKWSDYVNVDPVTITYDCSVVILMPNLALIKAFRPKRLPFV